MNAKKEKKIKRLRKAHIWPSILFLILSTIITAIAFMVLLMSTMNSLVEDRMGAVCSEGADVSRLLEAAAGHENSIIEKMSTDKTFAKAAFIFDADGNIIAGYGEQTYNKEKTFSFIKNYFSSDSIMADTFFPFVKSSFSRTSFTGNEFEYYLDTGIKGNLINKDGYLALYTLLDPDMYKSWQDDPPDSRTVITEALYWQAYTMWTEERR